MSFSASMTKEGQPVPTRKTHLDLILLGVFSLWWYGLGLGFLVLWLVRNRSKQLSSFADSAEVRDLETARTLGQASIVLFFLSLTGITMMVWGHGEKARRTPPGNEHRQVTTLGRETQKST